MAKYKIPFKGTIWVEVEVEANNKEEAIEMIEEEGVGVNSYLGNGGCDKLVGVVDLDCGTVSIYANDELEIKEDNIEEL